VRGAEARAAEVGAAISGIRAVDARTPGGHRPVVLPMALSPADLERLRPVLERIVTRLRPEEIWLFGSRAEDHARPNSDFDLLAVLPDGTPEEELDPVKAWSIVRGMGVPVDVVPCTRSELEEEKHEIDTLARAAFLREVRLYERAA
jgi:predicted nucleotidyltransferase